MSLFHDLKDHPFKKREIYEIHLIDGLFTGFTDETLDYRHKAACGDARVAMGFDAAHEAEHIIAKLTGSKEPHPDKILIKRLKGDIIKPIAATIHAPKGKKQRAARIEKRLREVSEEYAKTTGDSLREIRVQTNGKH